MAFSKLKTATAAIMLLLCAGPLNAADWNQDSRDRQAVYTALHFMDWAQTRAIAQNPERWHELNPILGTHPSTREVDQYFALTLAGHYLVANLLPAEYRSVFQHITISMEAAVTRNNVILGIKGEF